MRRYLHLHGITSGNGGRASPVDLRIGELRIEVKTASLGVDGTFQFNHVRLDRPWSHLLCLGICPDRLLFRGWPKGAVAEGVAGKLTKRADAMQPIEDLPATIRTL
ncbi:MAG: hypothetical protein F4Z95_11000 [Gammaproteobacteria bacterium]|nr:hypothetical protein [Gammaproteobacteria bacterium]